jgi:hypothetical protein
MKTRIFRNLKSPIILIQTTDNFERKYHSDKMAYPQTFKNKLHAAVPWPRRLVAGVSPRRPGLDPGSVHVEFVVDKVALGQVYPRVSRFSPVSFIPPVLHYFEKRGKKKDSSSSQGCTISLKAAVRP